MKMHKKRQEGWVWGKGYNGMLRIGQESSFQFNLELKPTQSIYWHYLWKVEQIFSKHPFGGGSLIWGAFSIKGEASLVKMEGKQKYTKVLEKYLLPFLANNYQNDSIFQQANTVIHTVKLTTKWLQDHNIVTLKSPDLNPIEDLWGYISKAGLCWWETIWR